MNDEAPLLDVEAIALHAVYTHDVVLEFVEPCPYCGIKHRHVDSRTVAVGAVLHRSAHCLTDAPRRAKFIVPPGCSYSLRVVRKTFAEQE
jgi:hypothetical protein